MTLIRRTALIAALILAFSGIASAQRIEVHPYIGGFVPGKWADTTRLKTEGLYGARGGVYLTQAFEIEGNVAYINHFRFQDRDMGTWSLLWDVNGSYSLLRLRLNRFEPFLTFGAGRTSVHIRGQAKRILLLDPTFNNPASTLPPVVLENGDAFLTVNYGGGFKAFRLWGPFGVRMELRGLTMPDFFGHANHWVEGTAGINISWGER
jgi:hypothetical protein